jgi:uncharacterized membrane protein
VGSAYGGAPLASGTSKDDGGRVEDRQVSARSRVLVAIAAGVVAFAIAMFLTSWQVASLTGWDVTALVFVVWVWRSVAHMDGAATAKHASAEDDAKPAAELILISACSASLIGVALALLSAGTQSGRARVLTTAVASITVVLSWAAVHTTFTLRYARMYHLSGGGIAFPHEGLPDYADFAYVAFTIGMTYQVSDTGLTDKEIRMTALRHALLSFVFGTGVLAMTINVVADLLRK